MLAHLRTEAYPLYGVRRFAPADASPGGATALSHERNCARIDEAKRRLAHGSP
jgi:hypothetical protein